MKIKRTANAGVLLELDGQQILLDGVCGEVKPYIPTPAAEAEALRRRWPELVAFTHTHRDHWDIDYARDYQTQTLRPILGPESLPVGSCRSVTCGPVTATALATRHLGRAGEVEHRSILVKGSKTVLFTGDAAPSVWRQTDIPKLDVLICPYAYATTAAAWQTVRELAPQTVVLVHFPPRDDDPCGLWEAALATVTASPIGRVYIPEMGQRICL